MNFINIMLLLLLLLSLLLLLLLLLLLFPIIKQWLNMDNNVVWGYWDFTREGVGVSNCGSP